MMKKLIVLILLLPFNSIAHDALLEAIYGNWDSSEKYEKDDNYSEVIEETQAEIYHWELGQPDNIPEIEVIYDESPCQL